MARNDWYTITEDATDFICTKMDPDDRTPVTAHNDQGTPNQYRIGKHATDNKTVMCNCFAGHRWCRHKQMVVIFQKEARVNSRYLYSFDKQKWLAPLGS
jgi:hypothetical protein